MTERERQLMRAIDDLKSGAAFEDNVPDAVKHLSQRQLLPKLIDALNFERSFSIKHLFPGLK